MYTSQNNKALHHAVGSPMNPHRMVVLSHLTCDQAIFLGGAGEKNTPDFFFSRQKKKKKNRLIAGYVSSKTVSCNNQSNIFVFCLFTCFFSQFLENLKYQILYLTKPSQNRSKFK